MKIFTSIILSVLLYFIHSEEVIYNHTTSDNLYFVFTTFRHGARTAYGRVDFFGNRINPSETLTPYGAIQHIQIGQKYRDRYSKFINMSFDNNQFYIRSSDVERTIVSTLKELEGFFNKTIGRNNIHIIRGGINYWNLFHLNDEEHREMDKYRNFCKKRVLDIDYNQYFSQEILPILKDCFGTKNTPNFGGFCDSVFTAYFQYAYGSDVNNRIGKCGMENATKIHDFCYNYVNTFRGWDEYSAYMFYMLYQHIFDYMDKAINGNNTVKMVMIGGHDITVDKFMNFLDGMKIIPRTHYPHYAYNIVIELRKYNDDFYLEFYYNDILRYNNTLEIFKNTLKGSKYSYLYNYCGIPPWITPPVTTEITDSENIQNETNLNENKNNSNLNNIIQQNEMNSNEIKNEENITQLSDFNIKNETIFLNNITQQNEMKSNEINEEKNITQPSDFNIKNETIILNSISQQNEINKEKNITQPSDFNIKNETTILNSISQQNEINSNEINVEENKTKSNNFNIINESIILNNISQLNEMNSNEIMKEENITKQNNFNITNGTIDLNNNRTNKTSINLKLKLKEFLRKDNGLNLFIILGCSVFVFLMIIVLIISVRIIKKRRRKFSLLVEEKNKSENPSVISVSDSKNK